MALHVTLGAVLLFPPSASVTQDKKTEAVNSEISTSQTWTQPSVSLVSPSTQQDEKLTAIGHWKPHIGLSLSLNPLGGENAVISQFAGRDVRVSGECLF